MYELPTDKRVIDWLDVTDENFDKEVLQHQNQIVVVEFWRDHCSSCDHFVTTMNSISTYYGKQVKLVRVKTGVDGPYQERFGFPGVPTVAFFFNGEHSSNYVGAALFQHYEANFLHHLSKITLANNMRPITRDVPVVNHTAPIQTGYTDLKLKL